MTCPQAYTSRVAGRRQLEAKQYVNGDPVQEGERPTPFQKPDPTMPIDDRCYLKTKPDDFFHAESRCLPCDGYNRSCDRYTSNKVMDEIRNRDWQNRNRPSKALDDYVNEIVRLNGR